MPQRFTNYIKYLILSFVFAGFSSAKAGAFEDFFIAIREDDVASVAQWVQRGFDPNGVDETGTPALIRAAQHPSPRVLAWLLAWPKTRVNAQNPAGESALMLVSLRGDLASVKALIARDADVNLPGWTPLHYAASKGHLDVMRELLEASAYIDAPSPNGTTPLMMAAHYGTFGATKLLLEEGADPTLTNQLGLAARDFAYGANHVDSAQLIDAFVQAWQARHPPAASPAPAD